MRSALLPLTHGGLLKTLTAGVPSAGMIAIYKHIGETRRSDVRTVVAEACADGEGLIA